MKTLKIELAHCICNVSGNINNLPLVKTIKKHNFQVQG